MKTLSLFLLASFAAFPACATTDTPQQVAEAPPVRPSRHPVVAAVPPVASPLSGASFGSPVVSNRPAGELVPRWTVEGEHGRLTCEGSSGRSLFSGQSPLQPSNAAIVRSFVTADHAVRDCGPPATPRGRLPIHAVFVGSGMPQEYTFPGVDLSERQALCVGRSLCGLRLPTFRQVSAAVDYEYLVSSSAVPDDSSP